MFCSVLFLHTTVYRTYARQCSAHGVLSNIITITATPFLFLSVCVQRTSDSALRVCSCFYRHNVPECFAHSFIYIASFWMEMARNNKENFVLINTMLEGMEEPKKDEVDAIMCFLLMLWSCARRKLSTNQLFTQIILSIFFAFSAFLSRSTFVRGWSATNMELILPNFLSLPLRLPTPRSININCVVNFFQPTRRKTVT